MNKTSKQKKTSRNGQQETVVLRTPEVSTTQVEIPSSPFPSMSLSADSGALAIAITSPQDNATLPGTSPAFLIPVSGNVSAELATAEQVLVRFGEDADWKPAALQDGNWSFTGQVFEPGTLKISAKVLGKTLPPEEQEIEASAKVITIKIAMTDVTPPELTLTSPQNDITVYGDGKVTRVPVRVEASDPVTGIGQIVWVLDDKDHLTEKFAPPVKKWSGTRDVRIPASKFELSQDVVLHSIRVVCTDAAGLSTEGAVTVKEVDITPPFYEIIEPKNGSKISGLDDDVEVEVDVFLRGTARDLQSGVKTVERSLDDGPYEELELRTQWDSTVAVGGYGPHKIAFRFTDHAGNVAIEVRDIEVVKPDATKDIRDLISPHGYLRDLIKYSSDHVKTPDNPLTEGELTAAFHQPFDQVKDLRAELANQPVNQLRLTIEVLRKYLKGIKSKLFTRAATDQGISLRAAAWGDGKATVMAPNLNQGLVAYWKFDEGQGDYALDSSGNNLTLVNQGPAWAPGRYGAAGHYWNPSLRLHFRRRNIHGRMEYFRMTSALSLCAWIYPQGAGSGDLGGMIAIKEGEYAVARFPDGTIRCALNNKNPGWTTWINSGLVAPLSEWTHVAVVYDRTNPTETVKVYLNGGQTTKALSYALAGDIQLSEEDHFRVGNRKVLDQNFHGLIDEMRLYNRPLTAEEVAALVPQPPHQMVAHWRFDEGSGASAADDTGNGNDATLQGGVAWATGKFGRALGFDGQDDFAYVSNPSRLVMSNAMTFCAWLHPQGPGGNAISGGIIIVKRGEYAVSRFPDGKIHWLFANTNPGWPTWHNTNYLAPVNQWTHIAVVYDKGNVKTYANGQLIDEYAGTGEIKHADPPIFDLGLGGVTDDLNQRFHGLLDDARLYNYALSAQEILALVPQPAELIAHWKLDERNGTQATDATRNANHGTLHGPAWAGGRFGGALSFDGVDDYVQVNNTTSLEVGKNGADFSVAFHLLLRHGATGKWRAIMHKGNVDNDRTFSLWLQPDNNRITYQVSTTQNEQGLSRAEIELNTWTAIAFVKFGNRLQLYINGTFDSDVELIKPSVSNSGPLYIGKDPWYPGINGSLDDVRVYRGVLATEEIAALAAPPRLMAHWKLDEESGTKARDATEFQNEGTLQGGAKWVGGRIGGALNFDGVDDWVSLTKSDRLKAVKNDFTIAFWARAQAKMEEIERFAIVPQQGTPESQAAVGVAVGTDGVRVYEYSADSRFAMLVYKASKPLSGWSHITVVYYEKQPSLYIDGTWVMTGSSSPKQDVFACPDSLGGHQSGFVKFFKGLLDDIRIYDQPLSEAQLADLMLEYRFAIKEAKFRLEAYKALLGRIGTSYEEIRLAHSADAEARAKLANKLGITLDPVKPDQLDRLSLLPERLTEQDLEQLFGFIDTTRADPLRPMPMPLLQLWRLEYLRTLWREQDYAELPGVDTRPPAIDPDLIGPDDLRSSVAGNSAYDLWQARQNELATAFSTLTAQREAQATALAGFDSMVADTLATLMANWKFDEITGGIAADSSSNGNDGTLHGSPTLTQGKSGFALSFDGMDDHVRVDNPKRLLMANVVSMCAWINPQSPDDKDGIIVIKQGEYGVARFGDGTIRWAFANSNPGWTWFNTGYIAPQNEWTHLAVVYDHGNITTYANGQPVDVYAGAGAIRSLDAGDIKDLRIGGYESPNDGKQYFLGVIDEVRIYRSALSADVVAALATPPALLLAHWRLDEIDGTTATDATVNGNHGTLQGPAWSMEGKLEGALRFDGVNDLVTLPGDSTAKNVTNDFTIAFWAKPQATHEIDREGTSGADGASGQRYAIGPLQSFDGGTPEVHAGVGVSVGTNGISVYEHSKESQPALLVYRPFVPLSDWTHITVVYRHRQPSLYVNGRLVRHGLTSTKQFVHVWPAVLGARYVETKATNCFGGQLDDVRIYDQAVSAEEIASLALLGSLPWPIVELLSLSEQDEQGIDISAALQEWRLTKDAFRRLVRVRTLAEKGIVTDTEWEDVQHILIQVQKSRLFSKWRSEEQRRQIALMPEYFKPSDLDQELLPWRATPQDRREWQNTLLARMAEEQAIEEGLRAAVSSAEETTLPLLRDVLVAFLGGKQGIENAAEWLRDHRDNTDLEKAANWLSDQLALDVRVSGAITTTRLVQALETIQTVLFSLRTGRFVMHSHPADKWIMSVDDNHFDAEWQWMGTHPTWAAAMLVFHYPEIFLFPSLRQPHTPANPNLDPTSHFQEMLTKLRADTQLTPQTARAIADEYYKEVKSSLPQRLQNYTLTDQLSQQELAARGRLIKEVYELDLRNPSNPHSVRSVFQELFYFVPMQLALQLEQSGEYVAALDWLQTIYAYNLVDKPGTIFDERKVHYGLELEKNIPPPGELKPGPHWLQNGLDPHAYAVNRPYSYTRYTLLGLVRYLLDYADAEFTRDTYDSVARARSLYMNARQVLMLPELQPQPGENIPPNPLWELWRLRVELQLLKIRLGRNIAGIRRQLDIDLTIEDPLSVLPIVGSGGQLVAPGTTTFPPTPYRYKVLIERAKQLIQLAAQMEASMFAAIEKADAEAYNLLRARQDIQLARAGVNVQNQRVNEANDGVILAQLQKKRAEIQVDGYSNLISAGFHNLEMEALRLMGEAATLQYKAEAAHYIAAVLPSSIEVKFGLGASVKVGYSPQGRMENVASGLSSQAGAKSTQAQIHLTKANIERTKMEWELQKSVAEQDVKIGDQQIALAQDHVAVAQAELNVARVQAGNAEAMSNFLSTKFTNFELYLWMRGELSRVYRYFLQQATAMARLAQNQLAFERQQPPPPFIQADYWQPPSQLAGNKPPDRRGLTGSARLLEDIYQLDQYAFKTDKRKLDLTHTFSLSRLDPFAFQQFRETGVFRFRTPMQLFDEAFPGHYLRLIRRVRTSVIALIPPVQGIRANLRSATGLSRVVISGEDIFREVVVRREPELVALTSPSNATGVFELDTQPDMLLPFEGLGVDAMWEFEMAKAANFFDYRTIADVLITFEYTALHSFDYRDQVIKKLDRNVSADRPFSFRNEFADQWYDLNNPEQTDEPMVVRFSTRREDFGPNIDHLQIEHVILYFVRAEGKTFEVDVSGLYLTEEGGQGKVGGPASSSDGIISTRSSNASSWLVMKEKAPIGEWELALPNTEVMKKRFKDEEIEDILLVITFQGERPAWPGGL